jgi:tetratricopeptide (TPR) repeat protein
MRNSTFLFLLLTPCWAWTQSMQFVSNRTPDTNRRAAETAISVKTLNVLPLFGETTKSPEQIEQEINFLNDCDQNFASRTEASQFFATRAWAYLQEGELDTACYRFNLAWLLDNKNVDCYWGLGVVSFQKGYHTDAERLLRRGIDIDSSNVGLLVDLATVDLIHFKESCEKWELTEAEQLLTRATALDSTNANAFLKKSVLEFHKGDFDASWKSFHKMRLLDLTLIDYEFLNELIARKPDPLGIFSDKK